MSLREASQHIETLGVDRSHVAIHEWVHKAELQPISTVTADQVVIDEKMIRVNGAEHWLYGAVDADHLFVNCDLIRCDCRDRL